ncbi:hypothetical protein C8R45DRAFT_1088550 [Mycena sanguinolenta]|nr:hypothetical protein C8R45DRAFT_1088550 [Mycena sanguinolenta]
MKNISYYSEQESVTLQPGSRWNKTLTYLEPFGVPVSGVESGTGLLLGGGLSHLSPQVGYSTSTLQELDVVLTNGTLVTANPYNEHADLFKALKGGAQRFGIVTQYELDAFQVGTPDEKNRYGGVLTVTYSLPHHVRDISGPKASMGMAFVLAFADGVESTAHFVIPVQNCDHLPSSVFGELLAIPVTSARYDPTADAATLRFWFCKY